VPIFGLILAVESDLIYNNQNLVPNFSDRRVLHGEHYLEIFKHPIPSKGVWKTSVEVLDVIDKGSAAITITGLTTRDTVTNEVVYYNEATFFLRQSGGFGGPRTRQSAVRGPPLSTPPKRTADKSIEHKTSEEQAALYRLTGDRVSMHIDPKESSKAGFPDPILHGACFLGITGYHILRTYGRYRSIRNRFSGVVIPGQTLRVEMWREPANDGSGLVCFQTTVVETGKRCIEGGVAVLVGEPGQKL
jgi:multifunctional beta-oxidation protein